MIITVLKIYKHNKRQFDFSKNLNFSENIIKNKNLEEKQKNTLKQP